MTKRSSISLRLVGSAEDAEATIDRRRNRRSSVVWAATLIVSDADKQECAVMNISLRGAKIRLRHESQVPEAFILHFAKFGPVAVRLLGQSGRDVRVAFLHDAAKSKKIFGATLPLV